MAALFLILFNQKKGIALGGTNMTETVVAATVFASATNLVQTQTAVAQAATPTYVQIATACNLSAYQTATAQGTAIAGAQAAATNAAGTAVVQMTATVTFNPTQTAVAALTSIANTQTAIPVAMQTAQGVCNNNYGTAIAQSFTPTYTPTPINTLLPTATEQNGVGNVSMAPASWNPQTIQQIKFEINGSYNYTSGVVEISVPSGWPTPDLTTVNNPSYVSVTETGGRLGTVTSSGANIFIPVIAMTPFVNYIHIYYGLTITPTIAQTPVTAGAYTWVIKSCSNRLTPGTTPMANMIFSINTLTPTNTTIPTINLTTTTATPSNTPTYTPTYSPTTNLTATTQTPTFTATPTPYNNPISVNSVQILSTVPQVIKNVYILSGGTQVHYCNCTAVANCITNIVWTISAPGASIPSGVLFSQGVGVYQATTYSSATNVTAVVINSY